MRRAKLIHELQEQKRLDDMDRVRAHMEKKATGGRFDRIVAEFAREDQIYKTVANEEKKAECDRICIANREETLAFELDQIKRDELKKIKERQLLRENCPELRELESKLRAAYIVKETKAQIAERQAIELENKLKEKQVNAILQSAWQDDKDYEKKIMEEELVKKHKFRQEIQEQLMYKESLRRNQYEEFLKEKKMLDEVIQRVHDEDQREILKKKADMRRMKQDMEDFKAAQTAWKENKRKELEEEQKQIQEFLQQQAMKASKAYEQKTALEKAKQEVTDKIAMKVYSDRKTKEDRHAIRMELLEYEEKEAIERRNQEDIDKLMRTTIDTRVSLTRQMAEKQERARREAEKERLYREEVAAQIAEDERKEIMKCEQKRQKLVQNRKYIEKMMEERRQKKAEEMLRQLRNEECDRLENEAKQKLIDEERINILKEHLPNVIDYLPPCLLNDDDWKKLGFNSLEEMKRAQM